MIIKRETTCGSNDLHVIYRPCKVDEIVGNSFVKKIIKTALDTKKVSHSFLFTGGAGCGKTSMARVIALGLNCDKNGISSNPCLECASCKAILDGASLDVREINVGQSNGKAYVDNVVRDLSMAPFYSKHKVLIFDEAHKLTTDAKDLLLKPLENGYSHVYFIFCTNQPEKLENKKKGLEGDPFLSRFSVFDFKRVSDSELKELLINICEFEGVSYNEKVIDDIILEVSGVPRDSIVLLDKVIKEASWETNVVKKLSNTIGYEEEKVWNLCIALRKKAFSEALSIFDELGAVSIESLRISVVGFFISQLKKAKDKDRCDKILDLIMEPIYDQGKLAINKWVHIMYKITSL